MFLKKLKKIKKTIFLVVKCVFQFFFFLKNIKLFLKTVVKQIVDPHFSHESPLVGETRFLRVKICKSHL